MDPCVTKGTSGSVLLGQICGESYRPALRRRRMHELSDGREDGGDRLIVRGELFIEPSLELCESACQFLVRAEQLAQLHEGAHDVDAHLDGTWAVENRGGHDRPVLGEGVWPVLAVLAAAGL